MQFINDSELTESITKLLTECKTIACVGLSSKEDRPSNIVARYMQKNGYTIHPVNPGQTTILGLTCYPSLLEITEPIEIIDIFRRSEDVLPIVEQALQLAPLPKVIWLQQGIINQEAAQIARDKGVYVVMDRCIKIDHSNFIASK